MTAETTPNSQASDGFLRLTFVPSGNNLSAAILSGGTAVDLTYSLTPTGWDRKFTENVVDDKRLTLKQILHRPGTFDEQITIQYVYTDKSAADKAYTALGGSGAGGVTGFITARYSLANATAYAAAQIVDSLTVLTGRALPDPATENGLWTMTQTIYLTAPTVFNAVLVA